MLLLGAGCSASGEPAAATGEAALPSLLTSPAALATPVGSDDGSGISDSAFEQYHREQLASAADPEPSALALVPWLAAQERMREALAVVDAALARRPGRWPLRLLRIEVMRDLGRRHVAVAELRQLLQQDGDGDRPELWLDLAELEWLEGHREAARTALARLRERQGTAPEPQQQVRLDALAEELTLAARPTQIRCRDLLGNLRGAPAAGERLRALQQLLDCGRDVRATAAAIAVQDADARVRAAGVLGAELDQPALQALLRLALGDDAAQVRATAASRTGELPLAAAAPLLLRAIRSENDALAFTVMHQALQRLLPDGPTLAPGDADSAASRAAVAAGWRNRWQ